MNISALHFSAPVLRLAHRAQQLSAEQRRLMWSVYRLLRKQARRNTLPLLAETLALELALRAEPPENYTAVVQGLHLARAYSRQSMSRLGPLLRSQRALLDEAFKLIHRRLQELLGLKTPLEDEVWRLNDRMLGPAAWLAICDGSFKRIVSAVGFVLYDQHLTRRAQGSLRVQAQSSVEAELLACQAALATLHTFGARQAQVLVDAQSVIHGLRQNLPTRLGLEEALVSREAQGFEALEVRRVSRVYTQEADLLAAQLSTH